MCLHPIMIKNVNHGNSSKLASFTDTTSQFIPIPCGRCPVCLALKQQYIVQRVQMESLNHDLFFGTLTYNSESLPICEVADFKLPYVDISDWQKMLKMIRKHEDLPPFRYFVVTEYGGRRHRPHIHFILSFPKDESQKLAHKRSFEIRLFNIFLKYWRRNYGSTRFPIWKPLCTYKRTKRSYNFDLHYLDPWSSKNGLDDVAFYASKYCLKYDSYVDKLKSKLFFSLSESDFDDTWNKIKPRRLMSKGFGSPSDPDVISHINKGINIALQDQTALYPYFISPVNGKTFPLSPYYSKKFLTFDDMCVFNSRKPVLTDNDMMIDSTPKLSLEQIRDKDIQFDVVSRWLDKRNTLFDEDFDSFVNNLEYERQIDQFNEMDLFSSEDWKDFVDPCDSDT